MVFVYISVCLQTVEDTASYHTVVLLIQFSFFIQAIKIAPVTSTMFTGILLQLLSAINHFLQKPRHREHLYVLHQKLLTASDIIMINTDITFAGTLGEHGYLMISHRNLDVSTGAVHYLRYLSAKK